MTRAELQRAGTLRTLTTNAAYWRDRGMLHQAAGAERIIAKVKARKVRP